MVSLFGLDLDGAFDAIKGATSDLFQHLDLTGPQQQAAGGRDPFAGLQLGGGDPFKGLSYGNTAFDQVQLGGDPFAGLGGLLGGSNPQTGYSSMASFGFSPVFAAFDAAGQKIAAKRAEDERNRPQAQGNTIGSVVTQGATYTGLPDGVARWADRTNATFGDLGGWVPAAMLAIIQHESEGSPTAYNGAAAGGAWGLFQQMGLGSYDPDRQFAAAKKLAQEKLAMVNAAYERLGINPDERTRARDLFLAWAGHFDPATAGPDSTSHDIGSGEDANAFLNGPRGIMPMYDNVVRGRQQASAPAGGGGTGMAGITPGVGGAIMQEFGPTDYAAQHPSTYAYGNAYGLAGSQHPGVDWAVPLGTSVATPLGGTVSVVGNDHGSGYYYTNTMSGSDPNRSGEFAITLDNGDILILGHMSQINVNVGDRLSAGALIGLSGGSDGAHVHVEYRRRNADGSYTIIDPRAVLGNGQPTGGGGASYR